MGLSAFSFVFSKLNTCSIGLKSGDWLGHCRIIIFFYLQKLLGCFCCTIWVIVQLYSEAPPNQLFDWIWADSISLYTSEFIRLLLSSVTSSLNTSIPVPLDVMHAHAFTPLQHVSQMMLHALDHELFQAFSILFLPIIVVYMLILISAVQRMLFQKWSGFFRCFWQSLIWPYLHRVVNPLYLPSWSLLLIVDFDSGMPSSWRVFFSWLDVVKGFFFTMERMLRSSNAVVLHGRPCLFMLLSSLVRSFFSEYTKLLIWPLLMLEA